MMQAEASETLSKVRTLAAIGVFEVAAGQRDLGNLEACSALLRLI